MISGDKNLLADGTPAHERLSLMRAEVEELSVFVWPQVHSLRDIMQAARKTRYDVVTAQDPFWRGFVAYHAARRSGARLNLQLHTEFDAQSLWKRIWGGFNLRRADSVRVVSEKIKDSLARLNLRAVIHILPIFVDVAPFKNLPRTKHPRFGKVILWIGRFEDEKDPLRAITALSEIRRERSDAGLVMLGAGSLEKSLRTRARARGLEHWVEFPGWQPPAAYLSQADVVLSTSRYEGYGASIIEALAAGVPVVAPDVGIAKEAGAIVVERAKLADAVGAAFDSKARGELKLPILTKEAWASVWRETL